jgi:hypothetical protein
MPTDVSVVEEREVVGVRPGLLGGTGLPNTAGPVGAMKTVARPSNAKPSPSAPNPSDSRSNSANALVTSACRGVCTAMRDVAVRASNVIVWSSCATVKLAIGTMRSTKPRRPLVNMSVIAL